MVARVPAIPKHRNGTFKPGHKLNVGKRNALGNRGPQAKLEKRYFAATTRLYLQEDISPRDKRAKIHKVVENIYDTAISKNKAHVAAARLLAEVIDGRPPQSHEISGGDRPIGHMHAHMNAKEAMDIYLDTITNLDDDA
jgi:hypothetical protein